MNKIKLNIALIFISYSVSLLASVTQVDVKDRIMIQKFYRSVYHNLFGEKEYSLRQDFKDNLLVQPKKVRKQASFAIKSLENIIPEKSLIPLIHWTYIAPAPLKQKEVLRFIFLHKLLVLRDFIDHPLTPVIQVIKAQKILKVLTNDDEITSLNLFEKSNKLINSKIQNIMSPDMKDAFIQNISSDKILSYNYKKDFPEIRNYVLTYQGFIPGNEVQLITTNTVSEERIDWFNKRVIFNLNEGQKPLDWSKDYLKMPTVNSPNGHVSFRPDNPIFYKMKEMVDEAKDSIFIDIFLFGGTLGATFAKYLIDESLKKMQTNPNFKVLLLHDYATNYNMLDEMMPIFRYIKNRIDTEENVAKMMTLLQANIHRHPPGIPFGITDLIVKTPETFKVLEKKSTYYESKIDHSKVMVIDANTKSPQAYFGSKNWSDHSGGYYYDNAIHIKGPGAALVQASYYYDVEAALTEDPKETAYFYFKEEGFDNKKYLKKKHEILKWMKIKDTIFDKIGNQKIRIAEADVDGKEKNVRNILVDMIKGAKSHIFMEQLFIYDRYIADALIKRKIQRPNLKIRILADHNGNFGLNGLPNTIFLKEMKDAGIEIKARKTLGVTAYFPNGKEQEYHQENHRKITSIDGEILLVGSSNLNADTLQGSFREFGAQIFDKNVIKEFENDFKTAWNSKSMIEDIDIDNFQVTIKDKFLSVELSAFINGLAATLLQSKDDIEKRHK